MCMDVYAMHTTEKSMNHTRIRNCAIFIRWHRKYVIHSSIQQHKLLSSLKNKTEFCLNINILAYTHILERARESYPNSFVCCVHKIHLLKNTILGKYLKYQRNKHIFLMFVQNMRKNYLCFSMAFDLEMQPELISAWNIC